MPLWSIGRKPPRKPEPAPGQFPADVAVIGAESLGQDWKEIGAGGFGNVYKARHLQWGWDVAVKLLCSDDGTFTDKDLINEAQLMRTAENQYVMKVLGFFKGCKPGKPFVEVGMVMELMENGSLASLQSKLNHLPPWPLVFRLVHQVALGMNFLHRLEPKLIHKDLKPQNILLDIGLCVKITDFGLAKYEKNKTAANVKGAATKFYAPPEFFEGFIADCAYDVYSYAVLLWSVLSTGHEYENMSFSPQAGGRPCLEYINGLQAEGLEELVKLLTECWSQKKSDRPSFTDCTAVTDSLYAKHSRGIHPAVYQVQMELQEENPVPRKQEPDPVPRKQEEDPVPRKQEENPVPRDLVVPIGSLSVSAPPVPEGSTNREDFLKHACALSLDPSSMNDELCLSEDNRKVTSAEEDQHHPDNQDRFAHFPQVLSSERLPERCYFEVKWSERYVTIAACYRDIDRKSEHNHASGFGGNEKSWILYRSADKYWVQHNGSRIEVFETEVSSRVSGDNDDGGVFGVYVGHTAGAVSFYRVSGDRVSLLHTVQTDATRPLYAGIHVPDYGTAEVCKIW